MITYRPGDFLASKVLPSEVTSYQFPTSFIQMDSGGGVRGGFVPSDSGASWERPQTTGIPAWVIVAGIVLAIVLFRRFYRA